MTSNLDLIKSEREIALTMMKNIHHITSEENITNCKSKSELLSIIHDFVDVYISLHELISNDNNQIKGVRFHVIR
jgi:hypothetical protein